MNFLNGEAAQKNKYSIERLRRLYGDLLKCIDHENRDVLLETRHQEASSSPRLGLRRKVFWLKTKDWENDTTNERMDQRRREVSWAFLSMAATRSLPRRQGNTNSQESSWINMREETSEDALDVARSMEKTVISCIRSIGEVVVNAEGRKPTDETKKDLRSDEAFEYFCEKAILALFVEIACETPHTGGRQSTFHGVVWSPHVKAQVFHTVSLLVAGVRDSSALYYLLSQNCMNKLIAEMLPLHQWTDPALEIMLPPYVEMLKTLVMQLGDSPDLFPFFTVQDKGRIHFPLFSSTLLTGVSSFAESNSFVHATCLNLVVEMLQIPYPAVQDYFREATAEQEAFADHLCSLLLRRYVRMVELCTGPVVDGIRSSAVDSQLKGLVDQLELLNDVFHCPVRGLKVRLCEHLLRKIIVVLWKSSGSGQRPLISTKGIPSVGVPDTDVIPASEASAQVAYVVLTQFLLRMRYVPALRMVGVALWHDRASPLWNDGDKGNMGGYASCTKDEYAYTKALHEVVTGNSTNLIKNVFRSEYYKTLRGDYGEWRVITATTLLFQCLKSVDPETLVLLEILPVSDKVTPVENAICDFLHLEHSRNSNISYTALECMASVAMEWLHCAVKYMQKDTGNLQRVKNSPVISGIRQARNFFFHSANGSEEIVGVSSLFVDIVETTVCSNYRRITLSSKGARPGSRVLGYNLTQLGCYQILNSGEVLVRRMRSVKTNEVEITRFHVQMALYYRATWRVMCRFIAQMAKSKSAGLPHLSFDLIDRAAELTSIFASLRESPLPGTDIDIRGRVSFPFFVDNCIAKIDRNVADRDVKRERNSSGDSRATFIVVLDPTDLFIVQPMAKHDYKRGTVVCCIPLLNVIAAATDGEWLHIAVRHADVGLLIKNGNMALRFDTPGTGVIVRQYVDRSRQVLRGELVRKIKHLFDVARDPLDEMADNAVDTQHHSKSIAKDDSASIKSSGSPNKEEAFCEDKKEIEPCDVEKVLLDDTQSKDAVNEKHGTKADETPTDEDNHLENEA